MSRSESDNASSITPPLGSGVTIERTFARFADFVHEFGGRLSLGGIFVPQSPPPPPGTTIDIDFRLDDGYRLFQAVGEVVWVRTVSIDEHNPAGAGARFHALDERGRELILKVLEEHVARGGSPFELENLPSGASRATDAVALPSIRHADEDRARAEDALAAARQAELAEANWDLSTLDDTLVPESRDTESRDTESRDTESRDTGRTPTPEAAAEPSSALTDTTEVLKTLDDTAIDSGSELEVDTGFELESDFESDLASGGTASSAIVSGAIVPEADTVDLESGLPEESFNDLLELEPLEVVELDDDHDPSSIALDASELDALADSVTDGVSLDAPSHVTPETMASPETAVPETAVPESAIPESIAPERATPEAVVTVPEVSILDISVPEVEVPDRSVPEMPLPATPEPDSEAAVPMFRETEVAAAPSVSADLDDLDPHAFIPGADSAPPPSTVDSVAVDSVAADSVAEESMAVASEPEPPAVVAPDEPDVPPHPLAELFDEESGPPKRGWPTLILALVLSAAVALGGLWLYRAMTTPSSPDGSPDPVRADSASSEADPGAGTMTAGTPAAEPNADASGTDSSDTENSLNTVSSVTEPSTVPATGMAPVAGTTPGTASTPVGTPAARDAAPDSDAAARARVPTDASPSPSRARPPQFAPARTLRTIEWREERDVTAVTIVAEGGIDLDRLDLSQFGVENRRVVIRIAGIRQPFDPGSLSVAGRHIERIRTGLHPESDELHVVLDLTAPTLGALGPLTLEDQDRVMLRIGPQSP